MEKHIIGENEIGYTLGTDGLYYPDLELPEGTHYEIGKYGRMRWEYLKNHRRGEYIRILMDGKLNAELMAMNSDIIDIKDRFLEKEIDEIMRQPISDWYEIFISRHKAKFDNKSIEFENFKRDLL